MSSFWHQINYTFSARRDANDLFYDSASSVLKDDDIHMTIISNQALISTILYTHLKLETRNRMTRQITIPIYQDEKQNLLSLSLSLKKAISLDRSIRVCISISLKIPHAFGIMHIISIHVTNYPFTKRTVRLR